MFANTWYSNYLYITPEPTLSPLCGRLVKKDVRIFRLGRGRDLVLSITTRISGRVVVELYTEPSPRASHEAFLRIIPDSVTPYRFSQFLRANQPRQEKLSTHSNLSERSIDDKLKQITCFSNTKSPK